MTTNHDALREAFNAFLMEQHERHKHQHNHFHVARNEWARRTQSTQYEALAASKPEPSADDIHSCSPFCTRPGCVADREASGEFSREQQEDKRFFDRLNAAPVAAKPEQQAQAGELAVVGDALPCCGYQDETAIKWNPFNRMVQCHNCGQVYTANKIESDLFKAMSLDSLPDFPEVKK